MPAVRLLLIKSLSTRSVMEGSCKKTGSEVTSIFFFTPREISVSRDSISLTVILSARFAAILHNLFPIHVLTGPIQTEWSKTFLSKNLDNLIIEVKNGIG